MTVGRWWDQGQGVILRRLLDMLTREEVVFRHLHQDTSSLVQQGQSLFVLDLFFTESTPAEMIRNISP